MSTTANDLRIAFKQAQRAGEAAGFDLTDDHVQEGNTSYKIAWTLVGHGTIKRIGYSRREAIAFLDGMTHAFNLRPGGAS